MTRAKNSNGNPFAAAADSIIWQMDNELAVLAVLLSACGASWLMSGVAGVGAAARLSRSLALSDSASCALAVAANATQAEKITARLPVVMLPPPPWLQLRGTGEPMWMIAQAFLRHKHPSQTGNSRIRWGASICAATKWRRSSRAEAKLTASQMSSKRKTRSRPQAVAREMSTMKFKKGRLGLA